MQSFVKFIELKNSLELIETPDFNEVPVLESVDPQFVGMRLENEKSWGQKLFKGLVKR